MGTFRLVVKDDYILVHIRNHSSFLDFNELDLPAPKNGVLRLPLNYLLDADATCLSVDVGTISGNELVIPTSTEDIVVSIYSAKARVSVENNVPYHVTSITPAYQFVNLGTSATFDIVATDYQSELISYPGSFNTSTSKLTVNTAQDPTLDQYVSKLHRASTTSRLVELGTNSSYTNSYNPTGSRWYSYSLTQNVYKSDEISDRSCFISQIAFYGNGRGLYNRICRVYMTPTDIEGWYYGDKYTPIAASDIVYNGNITFNGWNNITLNGYIFNPNKNLLLTVADDTGTKNSGNSYLESKVYSSREYYIHSGSDQGSFDVTKPVSASVSGYKASMKLYVRDLIEDTP